MPTMTGCVVVSRRVKRFALGPLTVLIAMLCSACLTGTAGSPDDNPPPNATAQPSTMSTGGAEPSRGGGSLSTAGASPSTARARPSTGGVKPKRETLAFGKSYAWDDGVIVTVGKPKEFEPSKWAVVEKSKRYVKFTVTVVNKSDRPVDIGRTYISVQSRNKEEDQLFDSVSGLKGVPDTKVLKGRASEFNVGFGVADPKDVSMEVALHDDVKRPGLHYSS
jgi:hypothetical protein